MGVFCQNFLQEIGLLGAFPIELRTDSSAGIAMCRRKGPGRVRHLSVKQLFIQELVGSKRVVLVKWPGEQNLADIGTKVLDPARIEMLIDQTHIQTLGTSTRVAALAALNRPGKRARKFLASLLLASVPSGAVMTDVESKPSSAGHFVSFEVFILMMVLLTIVLW